MQNFDSRGYQDCAFFLRGSCTKGADCPFRHDPTAITQQRQIQAQQDCLYFLSGRCTKGSLCAFRHDQNALLNSLAALKAKLAAAEAQKSAVPSAAAAVPSSGPAEARPGPPVQQQQQQPALGFAPRLTPAELQQAQPPQQQQAQPRGGLAASRLQQAPLASRIGPGEPSSGAATSASRGGGAAAPARRPQAAAEPSESGARPAADIPSRLAHRLGPAAGASRDTSAPAASRRSQGSEKRPSTDSASEVRPSRIRRLDGGGLAVAALQQVGLAGDDGPELPPASEQAPKVLGGRLGPLPTEAPHRKRRAAEEPSIPQRAAAAAAAAPKRTIVVEERAAPSRARPVVVSEPKGSKPRAESPPSREPAVFPPPKSYAEIRKDKPKQQGPPQGRTVAAQVPAGKAKGASAPAAPKESKAEDQDEHVEDIDEELIYDEGDDDGGDMGEADDDFEAQMRALEDAL